MKKFCKYCNHFTLNDCDEFGGIGYSCYIQNLPKDNFYKPNHLTSSILDAREKNKDNDCKDFEPRWYCIKAKKEFQISKKEE